MPLQHTQRTINSDQKPQTRVVTVDTAFTLGAYDKYITISSTAASVKVITPITSNFIAGPITIKMSARVAGSYTLAVEGGALTFDAAGETATVISNPVTDTWVVQSLQGATIV